MPETTETAAAAPTGTPAAPAAPADQASTPKTLEELLADLPEDRRGIILGEVGKARNEAKNLRDRLKVAEPKAGEYDRLAEASKTDAERAQEALRAAESRAMAATQRVARAEVKAALAGLVDNPDSIVDDINLAKFVTDDGEIDTAAVQALQAKFAAFGGRRAPRPDPSQASGANGPSLGSPAQELASVIRGLTSGR